MGDLSVAHVEQFASHVRKQMVDIVIEVSAPIGLVQGQQFTFGLLLRSGLSEDLSRACTQQQRRKQETKQETWIAHEDLVPVEQEQLHVITTMTENARPRRGLRSAAPNQRFVTNRANEQFPTSNSALQPNHYPKWESDPLSRPKSAGAT